MRKILLLSCLLVFFCSLAQKPIPKKVIQKPILLKPQTKNQIIGMEYKEDVLYFTKSDLLIILENVAKVDRHPIYAQVIGYLNAAPNEITLKYKDSTSFNNAGERSLYKILLEILPEVRRNGSVAIMNKQTKQFNSPKTKFQTISMEYNNEILYFSKADLIPIINDKSQSDRIHIYNPTINYLNAIDKLILFKYDDTTSITGIEKRFLHKIILEAAPQLLASNKASDKVKKSGTFNKQVFVNPCENNKDRVTITERKGRVIFGCE